MHRSDVPMVGVMERHNYDFPWSDAILRDCCKAGYVFDLLHLGDEFIGYGVLQVAANEGHILNLCIDRAQQRKGFARVMLEHLMRRAEALSAAVVFLEVRPSNPRAVELYEQSGFNQIGLRKGYYDSSKGREDAIVMARDILPSIARDLSR